jgi:hypothetical protein
LGVALGIIGLLLTERLLLRSGELDEGRCTDG